MKESARIRKALVSGQFYSDHPSILKKQITTYLFQASTQPDPNVCALIVPHAGYDYSGSVAAEAYRMVQDRAFERVVVIAFLHRIFLEGVFVDEAEAYETPLGRISVDQDFVMQLRRFNPLLAQTIRGPVEEHSLEVQIPFIQTVLPDAKLVPIYMGMQDFTNATVLADGLAETLWEENTLVIATTDLSHFHPYKIAAQKDHGLITFIETEGPEEIYEACLREKVEACGIGPVLVSKLLARKLGWEGPQLIRYANSGDVTGDHDSVVGYAAMQYKKGKS